MKKLRILVGCEFSGVVRDEFGRLGHDAWSCDLLPSRSPGQHIIGDVFGHLDEGWDIGVFFPPCTRLCVSGARWFRKYPVQQLAAIEFVRRLWDRGPAKCVVENPIGVLSTRWERPSQIIQPWEFGHGETKATCLWIRGCPLLVPTEIVSGRESRIHRMPPSADRGLLRSITYAGIARAMARQWGGDLVAGAAG